ncbi:MAG: peptidyl-prolyl cis-trans isomerase [Actinomycetota bacterium]|jgi:peptidyl-prolyl cis-trans isomerase B (cyclophilin B)|nr:peptidyl-prolyl cis-trans isomerase [Actinomycetota bacterium]
MMVRGAVALVVIALGATACGTSGGSGVSTAGGGSVTEVNANGCQTPPALQKTHLTFAHAPKLTIARTTYTARVVTNCGTIVVSLNGTSAPVTVNSFAFLSSKGFFSDTPCHRLTTAGIFVLQCGDPTGTGTGGPGYTIPDENLKGAKYPAGTLAMANTGQPHSGGSQFFFVYARTKLPPQYTPFGRVTSGLDVLTRIAKAGTDNANGSGDGHPKQPVVIESFGVTKG